MAQKRMFSLSVVDTDNFLEMPISSRLLYYELGMRADDDGFIDNWKKILMFTGLKEDDLKILIAKNFIIPFESGVIVIKHWRLNNYLRSDRFNPTNHQEEYKKLTLQNNNIYELSTIGIPAGIHSIDKNSIDKNSIDKNSIDILSSELDVENEKETIPYDEIIEYLNLKCGTNYKSSTSKTRKLIQTRFKEGFNEYDFKKVIDIMCSKWLNDKKMKDYLRPETLFGTKFESYLNSQPKEYTTSDLAKVIDWSDF